VIVEEEEKTKKKKSQGDDPCKLCGANPELWFYNFRGCFAIWAYIDVSCYLCGDGGYDNDRYYNITAT
jgi:hypothetical protein